MNRTTTRSILAVLLAGTAVVWAQQPPQQPQQQDDGGAPEHGAARISLVIGDVSVRRGDSGELSAAALNGPLVVEDHLVTGQNGRAEIQFDWGNMIRLGPGTEVRLGELEDRRYLVQIATGTTTFRVLRDSGADVEISTPTVSVRPAEQGSYRVTVYPDGMTEITVRAGRAEIFSPRGTETLAAGRTMQARGTPSDPEYMINTAIPQDEWDRWNADRDRALENTSSYRHVSPDVAGAEDLDAYGQWEPDPQYGDVWVPNVDPGWAPYRVGRWVDEPYYGWTWVSGDPWGWAPYHYGNWYMSSFGWAWYPGPVYGRHYWRPAMVSFFGWGSGLSVGFGFGFGNVGWVPLAPYERFRPWYGRGYNTAIVNNVRVESSFRNARFVNGRNGVTSVNAGDFGRGRAINTNNFVRASNNDLAHAGSVQGRLPFTASSEARRMSDRPVNTQSMPRVSANTRFAQRSPAQAATQRSSQGFSQGQGQAQAQGQRSPAQPAAARGGNSNGNAGGWRTFNGGTSNGATGNSGARPNTQLNTQPNTQRSGAVGSNGIVNNNSNGGGWRTFDGNRSSRPTQPSGVTRSNAPTVIGGERNNTSPVQPQGIRESAPRESAPRQSAPRESAPRQNFQQPVRISPPIARERAPSPQVSRPQPSSGGSSAPRSQSGGGGGNRGSGGGHSGGGGGHRR